MKVTGRLLEALTTMNCDTEASVGGYKKRDTPQFSNRIWNMDSLCTAMPTASELGPGWQDYLQAGYLARQQDMVPGEW